MFIRYTLAIVVMFLLQGCSKPVSPAPAGTDGGYIDAMVQRLAGIKDRSSGSSGSTEQVKFILKQLADLDVKCKLQEFKDITPGGRITFKNIIAEIEGQRSNFIIIAAHHDTKRLLSCPDFVGANDGASGVSALLAMIKALKVSNSRPAYTLRFIFFDGEECFYDYSDKDGLFGSRYYAGQLEDAGEVKKCRAVIVLDMIGDRELKLTLSADTDKQLLKLFSEVATDKLWEKYSGVIVDDHTPFQKLGIPCINLIDFEFGPDNSYWHTDADKLENIDVRSVELVANLALKFIWSIK